MNCPICNKQIPDDSNFCPKCGAVMHADAAAQDGTILMPSMYGSHICKQCGHFLPDGCQVCDYCGTPVSETKEEPPQRPPQDLPPKGAARKKKRIWIAAVILVVAAVAGAAIWYMQSGISFGAGDQPDISLSEPAVETPQTDTPEETKDITQPDSTEPETVRPQETEEPETVPQEPEETEDAKPTPAEETEKPVEEKTETTQETQESSTEDADLPAQEVEEVEWHASTPGISPPFSAPETPENTEVTVSRSDAAIIAWDYWNVYALNAQKAEDESYTVYIESDPTDEDPRYMVCIRYYKTGQPVAPVIDRIYIDSETGEVTPWT